MPLSIGLASAAGNLKNPAQPWLLGYRTNLVSNPTFEVNTTGWTSFAGATLTRTTSESYTGSASLEVANASASGAQYLNIPMSPGQGTYYVSAYIKLDSTNTQANYFIRYLQYEVVDGPSLGSGNVGLQTLSVTGNWVRLSGAFTKVAQAQYVTIRVATSSTTNTDVFFVDGVLLEKSSSLGTYFDGSTSGGFWSGTAHESFSGYTSY